MKPNSKPTIDQLTQGRPGPVSKVKSASDYIVYMSEPDREPLPLVPDSPEPLIPKAIWTGPYPQEQLTPTYPDLPKPVKTNSMSISQGAGKFTGQPGKQTGGSFGPGSDLGFGEGPGNAGQWQANAGLGNGIGGIGGSGAPMKPGLSGVAGGGSGKKLPESNVVCRDHPVVVGGKKTEGQKEAEKITGGSSQDKTRTSAANNPRKSIKKIRLLLRIKAAARV
jgi:hypothetical protein